MKNIILLLFFSTLIMGQNLEQKIDSIFQEFIGNSSGAAVGVFKDGKIIFSKGYGFADLQNKIKITPKTNFRLASVTKQFTSASILILAQRNLLKTDAPVIKYFPCLNYLGENVTIKNLLTHTSGIIDYEDFMPSDQNEQLKDKDVLKILCENDSTYFVAGSNYRYSNSAYALLSLIVEKLSGLSFADFLNLNIFKPLSMNNTIAYEKGISEIVNRAFGYAIIDGKIEFADQSLTSAVLGDGGIYSSVEDMFLWDQSLYENKILSSGNLNLSFFRHTKAETDSSYYGFGWRLDDFMNLKRIYHTGSTCGFSNVFMRFPDKNLSVVVLMNQRDLPALEYGNQIAGFILNNLSNY